RIGVGEWHEISSAHGCLLGSDGKFPSRYLRNDAVVSDHTVIGEPGHGLKSYNMNDSNDQSGPQSSMKGMSS
ncbi:MAG: hypothetical protein L0K10_13635, partial [Brevibacterium aurantiacum]|nr:hypothetical protein [Brevibacterium aurantiacum]